MASGMSGIPGAHTGNLVAQLAALLLPRSGAENWQCNAALNLNAGCSQHGGADCLVCAGKDQWVLRVAGCSNSDIQDYCNASPNGAHCSTAQGMAYVSAAAPFAVFFRRSSKQRLHRTTT